MGYAEQSQFEASHSGPSTYFAPPGRASEEALKTSAEACLAHPVVAFLMESTGTLLIILDEHRQILAANGAARAAAGLGPAETVLGQRPGELMGCVKTAGGPDGCGTSTACAYCGLVLAFLKTRATRLPVHSECYLTRYRAGRLEALEFEVNASSLDLNGQPIVVLLLQDISATKRREVLERIFYHDVANLAQGIHGWTELLAAGESVGRLAPRLLQLTDLLGRELRSHRAMAQAERGALQPHPRSVRPSDALEEVRSLLAHHPAAEGRRIEVDPAVEDEALLTDGELLNRIISNMTVNALEACPAAGTVTLSACRHGHAFRFQVHNPGEIPREARERIFQRSFSTKATKGRGLGTYAMKLFGENVLGGRVAFESGAGGTTFFIDLPQVPL